MQVFVDPGWIIDVLKGLIRHDSSLLLEHFVKLKDNEMIRRTRRLVVHGSVRTRALSRCKGSQLEGLQCLC